MPFIPHTDDDVRAMLAAIGVGSVDALFDEIPPALRLAALAGVEEGATEADVVRIAQARAAGDGRYANYIGAGAYEHHIPAAVWQIATRGEFYSAYTPYQAEASQGTLQVLYEYQSMMASLTGMDVTNASLYDGASALAEAVLMAVRLHKRAHRVLIPRTVHPAWRKVVRTIVRHQGIEIVELPYDAKLGHVDPARLAQSEPGEFAALVVPQPNFFGVLEPVDALTDWAAERGAYVVGAVNPVALGMLRPPGRWGAEGAHIAVGEGQPLGIPLSSGGPYYGFLATRKALVRQMPGRIVGRTADAAGRTGYTLTLQAREQHIRRSRATSNICTNQGLMVTASAIHMALLGPEGLARVARTCHANLLMLLGSLSAVPGVVRAFDGPVFHEAVLRLPAPVADVLQALGAQGILGGLGLEQEYPELADGLLVCVTETKNAWDLQHYASQVARIMAEGHAPAPDAAKPAHQAPARHDGARGTSRQQIRRPGDRMTTVTLRGNPLNVGGTFPKAGDSAPDFKLATKDLKDVSLADFAGKRKVISIVPSLDTPVCATSTKVFNEKAAAMPDTVVLVVSADLPFAQKRFCGAEGIENVVTLSTMRGRDFHQKYGVDIQDGPLAGCTARAVVVLDASDKVVHAELVPEIAQEPNYDAALAALK